MPYKNPEDAKARSQRYYQKNKDKFWKNPDGSWKTPPERTRRNQLLQRQYGITIDEYERRLEEQEYRCPICKRIDLQLNPDHNHKTKEVRGLLCANCNSALGYLGDKPENVLRAYRYLQRMGSYGN